MNSKISLKCKVCNRSYSLETENPFQEPIWKMENCSLECKEKFSHNKLLNTSDKKTRNFQFLKANNKATI